MLGLEQHYGRDVSIMYTTGYTCKGTKSTDEWLGMLGQIQDKLVEEDASKYTLKDVVGKFMYKVTSLTQKPKEETVFALSGGKISYNSVTTKSCSVNKVYLEDLTEDGNTSSWSFDSLKKRYAKRENWLDVNLYKWVALYSGKNEIAPNFFGYFDRPTLPLKEDWSKTMLIIYKPWHCNIKNLKGKHSTYVEALLEFLADPEFPQTIAAAIRKSKMKVRIDPSEGTLLHPDNSLPAPESEDNPSGVKNDVDEAIDVANATGDPLDGYLDTIQDAQFTLEELACFSRGEDMDWSVNYKPSGVTYFTEHRDDFYGERQAKDYVEEFKLFDTDIYAPEKCQGFAQTFLLALTLYALYVYTEDLDLFDDPDHPCWNVFVQGNPGTGKTFVVKTCLNVVRLTFEAMCTAKNTGPTGCAAALSNGMTLNRFFHFPFGVNIHKPPSDMRKSNTSAAEAFLKDMLSLFAHVSDEYSMKSRSAFAWEAHRLSEGRQSDAACKGRTQGGVPLRFQFGDVMQLPAVAATSLYDSKSPKAPISSDAVGRLAFHDYLFPDHACDHSVVVVMDKVIRQKDEVFRSFLQKLRDGKMDSSAVDFVLDRAYDDLDESEQELYWKEGIFLMPTWARTKKITYQYLRRLDNPIVVIHADISGVVNPAHLSDFSVPIKNVIMEGASIQLLTNGVVEEKVFNGKMVGCLRIQN